MCYIFSISIEHVFQDEETFYLLSWIYKDSYKMCYIFSSIGIQRFGLIVSRVLIFLNISNESDPECHGLVPPQEKLGESYFLANSQT